MADDPLLSVTETVMFSGPAAEGVKVRVPERSIVVPGGPLCTDHVYGGVPPVAAIVAW
jgi:hypothetical protein